MTMRCVTQIPRMNLCANIKQDALFKPPTNPETADQVERPNVAAIAAQEAVRVASGASDDEEKGESSFGGIDRTLSSSYRPSNNSRDGQWSPGEEYTRGPQHHNNHQHDLEHLPGQTNAQTQYGNTGPQNPQDSYRVSQEHRRTSRDHMASDAELLARTGHGPSVSSPRTNRQQPWV